MKIKTIHAKTFNKTILVYLLEIYNCLNIFLLRIETYARVIFFLFSIDRL